MVGTSLDEVAQDVQALREGRYGDKICDVKVAVRSYSYRLDNGWVVTVGQDHYGDFTECYFVCPNGYYHFDLGGGLCGRGAVLEDRVVKVLEWVSGFSAVCGRDERESHYLAYELGQVDAGRVEGESS